MSARWRRRAVLLFDVVVWALICLLVIYETRRNPNQWELVGGLLVTTVALASSRRLPLLSVVAAAASSLAVLPNYLGRFPVWPLLLMLVTGYLAGRRMEHAKAAVLSFAGVALAGLPFAYFIGEDVVGSWLSLVATLLFAIFVPWHLGRYLRLRENLARTGWERAERLEHEQRVAAEQARLRERARIATDMHDSLGHELSLIALRAGALEVSAHLDERDRTAAGELRESAAAATDRLHEIIGVLRADDEGAPVRPADEAISELVERVAASGMAVAHRIEPFGCAPPMVELAARRVVQEGLTNAAKHAPGAAVRVGVRQSGRETEVSVVNDPPPAGPLPGVPSGGWGLTGLRERVRLLGGSLRAGPDTGGGFEVVAVLPHDAPAQDPADGVTDSESARQLAGQRRQLRLTLINAVVLPLGVLIAMFAISAAYYLINMFGSVLAAGDYERMRIGQSRAELAPVLPAQQRLDRPDLAEPPTREGAVCEYYGTDAGVLGTSGDVYRLCFERGELVSKDVLLNLTGEVNK
ncbi:sensor histidine kinase [Amycolatopsis marina]|uniref:sensor histidine kinase n=1 Tax=Amycolatopsis marina TaxID=490629 RepID=UPI001FE51017|nr:histidine kinase [Amycolatopsis marina]